MSRISMARALLDRANAHRIWIGDDHGDRYEQAVLTDTISDEMQIVTKELLDHLRAALDYCAREVWEKFSNAPTDAKVYFPIARVGANAADFPSLMNRHMPGVPSASAQSLGTFESFQEFFKPDNYWLPDLATLANDAKHEQLTIASIPDATLTVELKDGIRWSTLGGSDTLKRGTTPWMLLRPLDPNSSNPLADSNRAVFLYIPAVRMELAAFLKDVTAGVERVIASCETLVA